MADFKNHADNPVTRQMIAKPLIALIKHNLELSPAIIAAFWTTGDQHLYDNAVRAAIFKQGLNTGLTEALVKIIISYKGATVDWAKVYVIMLQARMGTKNEDGADLTQL